MSWDVSIEIDTGGKESALVEEVRNVTYNNSRIFSELGVHPSQVSDPSCLVWIALLKNALKNSFDPVVEKKLDALSPENGWGGVKDSRDFLTRLLECCERHPKAFVKWS